MSSRLMVVVASRVLCAFFLYTVFGTLTTLPLLINTFLRDWQMMNNHVLPASTFQVNALAFGTTVLRLGVDLLLAFVFYQCGPRVAAFLTGDAAMSDSAEGGSIA